MKTIYKYPFPLCNPNSIAIVELPKGAKVVRLDTEGGHPFLWAIVDTEKPKVNRQFFLHKTGSNMDETIRSMRESKVTGFLLEGGEGFLRSLYLGRFPIWAEMELMMYVFDGGEV